MHYSTENRKAFRFDFMAVALALFSFVSGAVPHPAFAAERQTVVWKNDAGALEQLEQICLSRDILSGDVLWANGYAEGNFPSDGESLLVPESKSAIVSTWMKAQAEKNAFPDLAMSIKLHGVPVALRKTTTAPDTDTPPKAPVASIQAPPSFDITPDVPAAASVPGNPIRSETMQAHEIRKAQQDPIKNMKLVVSGDDLVVLTPSGSRVMNEEPPPAKLAGLPPLILNPTQQPPRTPTKPRTAAPEKTEKMIWPVSGKVSSGFGKRGKRSFHAGLDLPMPEGTPILAAMDGVVIETCTTQNRKYRGYGNAVLIKHANGLVTMYAHCQKVTVKTGQKVRQGDIVGLVGNTGRTTTWHVHFEIRKNGKPVDPMPYMTERT